MEMYILPVDANEEESSKLFSTTYYIKLMFQQQHILQFINTCIFFSSSVTD